MDPHMPFLGGLGLTRFLALGVSFALLLASGSASSAPDLQDVLCARWSDNCTACTSVEETPDKGKQVRVRCQFVVGSQKGGSACVGQPVDDPTAELSEWIGRNAGITPGSLGKAQVYSHASPACRLILREPSLCTQSDPQGERAQQCAAAEPTCDACTVRQGCGFCGERQFGTQGSAGWATVRCVTGADATLRPEIGASSAVRNGSKSATCAVRCESNMKVFDLLGPLLESEGLIEYPFWRSYGMVYAPGQRCAWYIGGFQAGSLSGSLEYELATHDALYLTEASGSSNPQPRKVVGTGDDSPLTIIGLAVPVTLEFFSDEIREASGFSLRWDYTPVKPHSSIDGQLANNPNDAATPSLEDDLVWLIPLVVVGSCSLIGCCVGFDCLWKRRNRKRYKNPQRPGASHVYGTSIPQDTSNTSPQQQPGSQQKDHGTPGIRRNIVPADSAPADLPKQSLNPSSKQTSADAFRSPSAPKASNRTERTRPHSADSSANSSKHAAANVGKVSALPLPDGLSPSIELHIAAVREQMLASTHASESDRKALLRELQRRWHPDKNHAHDKAISTAVFQYINCNSSWFVGSLTSV
ncbi:unnamed protein product [Polarella glacialis]|uniref:Uncharacterized protein n=1 Tax=Polarella glacialis TaxID=89957 RepID=A0A813LZP7_POLGL|nr:unnamed protein product [Polarella glacialis]